ncbi:tubulin-folding cofactor C [Magnolia sinica]|uniref:tubulin-folding cofactor C n=1 Tax=Magnolia sinica TaxID=86752 RepID=UPI00265A29F1|nr:tubulin-folding cofactor C [Magnolia sinica]XP_058096823.1 tubulin-folding cofactor C [Magnolia sinica]XP_058096824.1 tubulin-folding cofactor C [Magnolia sinica]
MEERREGAEDLSNLSQSIASPKTLNLESQNKHSAIIQRLSNPIPLKSHSNSSSQSTQSFLDLFSQSKLSIQTALDRCRQISAENPDSKSHLKSDLDSLSAAITDLEKLLAENSYFLPSYELRSSLKSIAELKESLESTSSELLPRKKFAFRNKPAKKNSVDAGGEAQVKVPNVDRDLPGFQSKIEKVPEVNPVEKTYLGIRHSPGFQNKVGGVLVKQFKDSEDGDFTLSDLESCEIRLKGRLRALFIHRLRNCRVYVGPVSGSIHIEEVEGCLFMLASHQIRIHHAKATDFYLRVRSRPIIEDSSGVGFAPYGLVYEGIEKEMRDSGLGDETGNWANVDDFRWLRAMQSPNWCILPEEDRVGTVNISDSMTQNRDDESVSV